MKKTAKQMFEELGFEYKRFYDDYLETEMILCEGDGVLNGTKVFIHFNTSSFNIETEKEFVGNLMTTEIPLPLLKAINKQVEELGWGKGEENE